jgi:glutamate--cysteine ligase
VIKKIEQYLIDNKDKVEAWLAEKATGKNTPIFTSIDIRNAGFKIAHVDTNLYPAGFNNLSDDASNDFASYIGEYIISNFGNVKKVLIYPESFTRNTKYLESLKKIEAALLANNYEVRFGIANIEKERLFEEFDISILPLITKDNDALLEDGFRPDVIIVNNDLTSGLPAVLRETSQPIIPSLKFGWYKRKKYMHFEAFNPLIEEFCNTAGFDPWFLSTIFTNCEDIDFRDKKGLECLASKASEVLDKTAAKYKEHKIKSTPYVFIKANMGTYGMGVMSVKHPDEILNINKKDRHSMDNVKSKVKNTSMLLQEGVPTIERFESHSAESLAYMCGGKIIEIFSRWHEGKDMMVSLNAKGAKFVSVDHGLDGTKHFLAKLASIATEYEHLK